MLDALDRHARRREEGIPTLSVLVGPPERGFSLWETWLRRSNRSTSVAVREEEDDRAIILSWARELARHRNLSRDAETYLHGPRQPTSGHVTWEICQRLREIPLFTPGHLPEPIGEAIAYEPHSALQALLSLVPRGSTPALHVSPSASGLRSLRLVASLCAAAPGFTVGCMLSRETFAEYQRRGESRVLAMLREGRLDVADAGPPSPVAPSPGRAPELARLLPTGAPGALVSLYSEATRAVSEQRKGPGTRSHLEVVRFLHELLNARAATAGLFELWATLDDGRGHRPVVVDLLCRPLGLAVQFDAGLHLRDAETFRSTQRKDLELQRTGHWVARFLTEDAVTRLEELLDTLDSLIADRRRTASGQEIPNERH